MPLDRRRRSELRRFWPLIAGMGLLSAITCMRDETRTFQCDDCASTKDVSRSGLAIPLATDGWLFPTGEEEYPSRWARDWPDEFHVHRWKPESRTWTGPLWKSRSTRHPRHMNVFIYAYETDAAFRAHVAKGIREGRWSKDEFARLLPMPVRAPILAKEEEWDPNRQNTIAFGKRLLREVYGERLRGIPFSAPWATD